MRNILIERQNIISWFFAFSYFKVTFLDKNKQLTALVKDLVLQKNKIQLFSNNLYS
jgi:hypothetical protein